MPTGVSVPLGEYLSSMYDPDCEWVEGELIERNTGEFNHSTAQGLLLYFLFEQRRRNGTHVFPALRIQLASRRFRISDILVTTGRVKGRILREPPFLCVEVVSPEDRISRMEAKIAEYLQFGVQYVWLVDPRERRAWVYTSRGRTECERTLETSNPDISIELGELFRAIDEELEP